MKFYPAPVHALVVICPGCERQMLVGPEVRCQLCRTGCEPTQAELVAMSAKVLADQRDDPAEYAPATWVVAYDVRYGRVTW